MRKQVGIDVALKVQTVIVTEIEKNKSESTTYQSETTRVLS